LAKEVFDDVAQSGDQALMNYTEKFDKVKLEDFSVSAEEIEVAKSRVPEKLKLAIQKAKDNIYRFHTAQKTKEVKVETQMGVNCWQKKITYRKGRLIHSWRICTLVFHHFDVGHSRSSGWMQ
jgi:histidinol dehydrogenase